MSYRGGELTEEQARNLLWPDKLMDLHGYGMRVVTFHFPPRIFMVEENHEEESHEGSQQLLYGVDIEVCHKVIAKIFMYVCMYSRGT